MNKLPIFLLILAGIAFSAFTEVSDDISMEWSDNDFQAIDVAVGNIDSDPQFEAVVVGAAGSSWDELGIAVFELSSSSVTLEDHLYRSASDALQPTSVMLCDVDGDGTKDVVVGGYTQTFTGDNGFVYTYDFSSGSLTSQYDYDWAYPVRIHDVGAKQGAVACNVNAVGEKTLLGHEYVAVLNIDSGTFDIYHEDTKTWFSDSSGYAVDFFSNGSVITAGTAESGWLSTQYVSVVVNPGNNSDLYGSTTVNKQATSVKAENVTGTIDEEIIVGLDSSSMIMSTVATLLLYDDELNALAYYSITPNNTLFYDTYMNDVDACDLNNDGTNEVLAAVDYDVSNDYGSLRGYHAVQNMSIEFVPVFDYDAAEEGYETSLQAIQCREIDLDSRAEVVAVLNLANSSTSDYRIKLVVLEYVPQVPVISVVSPSAGEALSGMFTAVINVSDDSPPDKLAVSWRMEGLNFTSYYTMMNRTGSHFYKEINLSMYDQGPYTIYFKVVDEDGETATESVNFHIDNSTFNVELLSPPEDSFVMPGTGLAFSGSHPISSFVYSIDNGTTNNSMNATPYIVDTTGWSDGPKKVIVWAESTTGKFFHGVFSIVIDGTSPLVSVQPSSMTVSPGDEILITVQDYSLDLVLVQYNNVSIDYTGSPMPFVVETGGWQSDTALKIRAADSAGNIPTVVTYPFTVVLPEAEEPPEDYNASADFAAEVADLIAQVEQEIADSSYDTSLAVKIIKNAKRLYSLGKYADAQQAALDAQDALAQAVPPEEPEPPEPQPPEQPPIQPPEEPEVPEEPQQPPAKEGIPMNYLLIAGGALLLLLLLIAAYLLLRKKGKPEYPKVPEEPIEFETDFEAEPKTKEIPEQEEVVMEEEPVEEEPMEEIEVPSVVVPPKPKKKPKRKAKPKPKKKPQRKKSKKIKSKKKVTKNIKKKRRR